MPAYPVHASTLSSVTAGALTHSGAPPSTSTATATRSTASIEANIRRRRRPPSGWLARWATGATADPDQHGRAERAGRGQSVVPDHIQQQHGPAADRHSESISPAAVSARSRRRGIT